MGKVTLTDEQYRLIKSNSKYTRIIASAGSGKAIPLTTTLLTVEGGKKAGDILISDKLIDEKGNPTFIRGIYLQGKKRVYEIYYSDGLSDECCKDHLWKYIYADSSLGDIVFKNNPNGIFTVDEKIDSHKFSIDTLGVILDKFSNSPGIPIYIPILQEGGNSYVKIMAIIGMDSYVDMVCFEVDSPYHTYVLGNKHVTHNTTTLVKKIESLLDEGIKANKMLVCSFTNKASDEIKSRIVNNLQNKNIEFDINKLWVGTIHSICLRFLRSFYKEANLSSNFSIIAEYQQLKILNKILMENGINNSEAINYKNAISFSKNFRIENNLSLFFNKLRNFVNIFNQYNKTLIMSNLLDFDDILLKTDKLLENNNVLLNIRNMFNIVMVDEFQDINEVQYEIFKKIVLGENIRYIVVGDDDQCIYSFRGSNPNFLIDNFTKDFSNVETIYLSINHRCNLPIVKLGEQVIMQNEVRLNKSLKSSNLENIPIYFRHFESNRQEASFIARRIKYLIKENNYIYNDFCILYRTQRQSRILEEFCVRYNIPYKVTDTLNFFDRSEVKDVLSILNIIAGINDDSCIERVINTPARGVGSTTLNKLKLIKSNLWDVLLIIDKIEGVTKKAKEGIVSFVCLVNKYLINKDDKANDICKKIRDYLKEVDYFNKVFKNESQEKKTVRVENIDELLLSLIEFLEKGGTIKDYFKYIEGLQQDDKGEYGVSLMTMHASKGLEFTNVFLAGVQNGLLPHKNTTDIDSERRLFYVAITRAKKRLEMSCGGILNKEPALMSSFLSNIKNLTNYVTIIKGD